MHLPSDQHEVVSYIIFKKDGDVFAKSGDRGDIEFSGDASTVIQDALNALPSRGGRIFIRNGHYELDSEISMPDIDSLVFRGSAMGTHADKTGTTLEATGGQDYNLSFATGAPQFLRISDLTLDSGGVDVGAAMGDWVIERLFITYAPAYGLNWTTKVHNIRLQDLWVENSGDHGIHIDSGTNIGRTLWIDRCFLQANEGSGLRILNQEGDTWIGTIIRECSAIDNGQDGIYLNTVKRSIISNSASLNNARYGIVIDVGCENILMSDLEASDYQDTATQDYGFYGGSGLSPIVLRNSIIEGNVTGPIENPVNFTEITNVRGYKTANQGSASVADGDTIAHGLDETPEVVILETQSANQANPSSIDASDITVSLVDQGGSAVTTAETVLWRAYGPRYSG